VQIAGSTQRPSQSVWPVGQAQAPPRQVAPSGQALPQFPQLASSVETSTHRLPQHCSEAFGSQQSLPQVFAGGQAGTQVSVARSQVSPVRQQKLPHWTRSGGQERRQVQVGSQTDPGAQQATFPVSSRQQVASQVILLTPSWPSQQVRPCATQAQRPESQ
jgi:hypothetical protein